MYVLRILINSFRGFIKDECFYKASALTFYTLLSIVPILAIAFGIAKGFGLEQYLEQEVNTRLLEHSEVSHQIIVFSYAFLANTHGGIITIIGIVTLLWTSMQLFSNVELSLNYIWNVQNRTFLRQLSDYLAILFFGTILFVASSALSVLFVSTAGIFLPLLINWLMFSSIYYFLPNTHVKLRYALTAGIIAGTAYQIVQWIYIYFQIGVASYGAIYGSFAALPLFLVWVNTSWTIVLAGAEIAFNLEVTPKNVKQLQIKYATEKQIGLWLTAYCVSEFLKGNSPVSLLKIENESGLPLTVVKKISKKLCFAGILDEDRDENLLIAKNPQEIKVKHILQAFEKYEEKFPVASHILYFDQAINDVEKHDTITLFNKSIPEIIEMQGETGTPTPPNNLNST